MTQSVAMKPAPQLRELFRTKGRQVVYKKGEIVIYPDQEPSGVYYIKAGHIKVYTINSTGGKNMRLIFKSDELFPLIWTLTGRIPFAFYEAAERLFLYKVPRDTFLDWIKNDPQIAASVYEKLAALTTLYAQRIDNLEYRDAYRRIVYGLLCLAERFGKDHREGIIIQVPLTHQDIADSLTMTRETASREIKKLTSAGFIDYRANYLIITDLAGLEEELAR